MPEPREHLPLGAEAFHAEAVERARPRQFERGFLLIQAIGTLDAIDRAHSATAEHADQTPRSQTRPDSTVGGLCA
jgi:hypothetical protein